MYGGDPFVKAQRIMDKATFLSVGGIVIVCMLAIMAFSQFAQASRDHTAARLNHVQIVCDSARVSANTSLAACDNAQADAHAEYLCNTAGQCWVEAK